MGKTKWIILAIDKSILNIHKISDTQLLINTDGFGAYLSDLKLIKQLPKSEFSIVNNVFIIPID